jgi:hypothetical protein
MFARVHVPRVSDAASRAVASPVPSSRPRLTPPQTALALQQTAGNRAVVRQLLRQVQSQPDDDRPQFAFGDRGPAVVRLQLLLEMPDPTGVFDQETSNRLSWFQGRQSQRLTVTGLADPETWAALEEHALIAREPQPTQRTVDDLSEAHKRAVASVVNRHLDLVSARIHVAGAGQNTVRDRLRQARESVTRERNESEHFARNVILRDAQRYLYGRLAPYTDAWSLRLRGEADDRTPDEVFGNPPSDMNVRGAMEATWEYELLKAHMDVRTTVRPSSPLGGLPFYDKGVDDAQRLDVATGQWRQERVPQHMDTSNIEERHEVGSAGSEDA